MISSRVSYSLEIGIRYLRSKKRATVSMITLISIVGVALGVLEGAVQLVRQRVAEGVERVGSIERDGPDVRIGRDVEEILALDGELVAAQLRALGTALDRCDAARTPELHDLLSRMRVGEQRHADWIAAQSSGS